MTQEPDMTIRVDDRIEVVEGSWAGRLGVVTKIGPDWDYVVVAFDDEPGEYAVRGCTLAKSL
jgi:transcription antitermination factor NusG